MSDQRAMPPLCPPLPPDQWAQLRAASIFRDLPDDVVTHVLRQSTAVTLPTDGTIFRQGEMPVHLYIIVDGEVGLTGLQSGDEHTVLEILSTGAAFVEAAAMTDQPYLMGAKCLRPTTLLMVPAAQLREDLGRFPELAKALVSSLSAHFRVMVSEVKDLKLKSASQRLGMYLLRLTNKREGPDKVILPHSKTVIAAKIGIRRETFSRAFNALAEVGVMGKGVRVVIADIARLQEYCVR